MPDDFEGALNNEPDVPPTFENEPETDEFSPEEHGDDVSADDGDESLIEADDEEYDNDTASDFADPYDQELPEDDGHVSPNIPYERFKQVNERARDLEQQLYLRDEAARAGYADTEQYLRDTSFVQSQGYASINEYLAESQRQMQLQQEYQQKLAEINTRPGLTDEDRRLLTTATQTAFQAQQQLIEVDARYRSVQAQEQVQAVDYARSILGDDVFTDPELAPIFMATDSRILRQFAEGISKHFQQQKQAEIANATARYAATKLKQRQQISPEGRGAGASPPPTGSGNVKSNIKQSFTDLIFGQSRTG